MEAMVQWLLGVEQLAHDVYSLAAKTFVGDERLVAWLQRLADEEDHHVAYLEEALDILAGSLTEPRPTFLVDYETQSTVRQRLEAARRALEDGSLTRQDLLSTVVDVELSEWNDVFLFVINRLKEKTREFQHVAARMQRHIEDVRRFLADDPCGSAALARLQDAPEVWQRRILVVDDEVHVVNLLSAVLRSLGTVETAADGAEALRKVWDHHFDAIVSDIEMPEMNGIEFFDDALKTDPTLVERFLFFSGLITQERRELLEARGAAFMTKPADITTIRRRVAELLDR